MSGLTSKDKQYFINLIRNDVSNQIREAEKEAGYDQYDFKKLLQAQIREELGINAQVKDLESWKQQIDILNKKIKATNEDIDNVLEASNIEYHYRGWEGRIENEASRRLPEERKKQFPELSEKVERLEKIKRDSEGVIRIVTTSKRLQAGLQKLLETYGIDLHGLKNAIPDV